MAKVKNAFYFFVENRHFSGKNPHLSNKSSFSPKNPKFPTKFCKSLENFQPFERNSSTLARKWIKPGTKGLEHRIGGLEKDSLSGNINYDAANHAKMTKLRKEKIQNIEN